MDPTEETIGEPVDDVKDLMRQAREMIPVGPHGAVPSTFAGQVDFARDMAKAKFSIPEHLRNNVGDCLAIVDMASRAGLSPYMVAQKTYVQNGRINFESQLYHAFVQSSGLLKGDLIVEYEGEGDALVCVITGYLKGDPQPRIHRSDPISKMHPGHIERDGKRFVRGSPLWDKKPKLQLFYDTSRDWVRMYAPRATLGILTPYETEEYGPDRARDVTPVGLSNRLKAIQKAQAGYRDGHTEAELDQMANAIDPQDWAAGLPQEAPHSATESEGTQIAPEGEKRTTARPRGRPRKMEKLTDQKTVAQYGAYADRWMRQYAEQGMITDMGLRWREEKAHRNKIGMTADDRKPLEELMAKLARESQ